MANDGELAISVRSRLDSLGIGLGRRRLFASGRVLNEIYSVTTAYACVAAAVDSLEEIGTAIAEFVRKRPYAECECCGSATSGTEIFDQIVPSGLN